MRKRVREADLSTSSSSSTIQPLPQEALDIIFKFAFNWSLREQQREELIRREIGDGIRRLAKRGTNADLVIKTNKVVVGTCCTNKRQAIQELRMNLLENPFAPFDKEAPENLRQQFEYRSRWRRFCAWSKGGPAMEKYPTHLLMQALMQGRL